MFEEDFILRMIRMATAAMVQILGLKQAGQYQEAQELVDRMLEEVLGLNAEFVKRLDEDSLLQMLSQSGQLDLDRSVVVADLFKVEGDLLVEQKQAEQAYLSYLRALNLYLEVILDRQPSDSFPPDKKIEALIELLGPYQLPVDTRVSLFYYQEQTGSYAEAEKTLAGLEGEPGLQDQARRELASFYARLLQKDDAELERGGIERGHLIERLESFK
jgi:tetratricopeptide (TPR) repeat protein